MPTQGCYFEWPSVTLSDDIMTSKYSLTRNTRGLSATAELLVRHAYDIAKFYYSVTRRTRRNALLVDGSSIVVMLFRVQFVVENTEVLCFVASRAVGRRSITTMPPTLVDRCLPNGSTRNGEDPHAGLRQPIKTAHPTTSAHVVATSFSCAARYCRA